MKGWGENWDAFRDCLSFFDAKERDIYLIHKDLPFPNNARDRRVYLEILHEAIHRWQDWVEHKLYVYFPERYLWQIDTLVNSPGFDS